jgi:hypothetical protein
MEGESKSNKIYHQIKLKIMSVNYEYECPECDGDGSCEIGPECGRPASNCCGGCYHTEVCKRCSGEGSLEVEMNDEDVQCVFDSVNDSSDILYIRQLIIDLINSNNC